MDRWEKKNELARDTLKLARNTLLVREGTGSVIASMPNAMKNNHTRNPIKAACTNCVKMAAMSILRR